MALDGSQLALTAEIVREPYADVVIAAAAITPEQELLLIEDLEKYEPARYLGSAKLKGGSDGVDFDSDRKEAKIFYRVRNLLGFPLIAFDLSTNDLELFEMELGAYFA